MIKSFQEVREELDISSEEVCLNLKITKAVLNKIESGKEFSINYRNYLAFLKRKGVNLNQFFED